jgi:hypothetical protein
MNRLVLTAVLALGTCASLSAQQTSTINFASLSSSTTAASNSFHFALVPELALPASSSGSGASEYFTAQPGLPEAPAPAPQRSRLNEDRYSWDLAFGYEYIHFHSAPFNLNLSGVHTDLTYNFTNSLGIEGNLISAWGGQLDGERSKYVLYTGGVRLNSGFTRRGFSPWLHALVGGAHLNPQVAREGKNGFALQAGGGVDFVYNNRVSLRGEADYLRTMLYSSTQNNFQLGIGAVIHF